MTARKVIRSLVMSTLALACAHGPAAGGLRMTPSVVFAAGREPAFALESTRRGTEVVDASGRRIATVIPSEGDLRILDPSGADLARLERVEQERPSIRLVTPDRKPLYALSLEPDGDLHLEDPTGRRLYQMKRRDYGFKVVDGDGRVESRVRAKNGKISLRDRDDLTYLSTRDPMDPAAVAVLSLDALRFEYAVALAIAVEHWGPWTDE